MFSTICAVSLSSQQRAAHLSPYPLKTPLQCKRGARQRGGEALTIRASKIMCYEVSNTLIYLYKSTRMFHACESHERESCWWESMQRARGAKYNHIIFWRLVPREIYINIRCAARVAKRSYGIGLFWIVKEFFLFNTAIKHIAKQLMRVCARAREKKKSNIPSPSATHIIFLFKSI